MRNSEAFRFRLACILITLMLVGAATTARAQIIIIDRRPEIPILRSYQIREVAVSGTIRDQVAEIQVTHTIHNPGTVALEAELLLPVPEEGAIQSMTLLVDGKELPGRLMPKDEARGIYEEIVRRKRDPALMEYIGQGLYRTRVFPIPGGADRQVTVRYTQLCRADKNVVRFSYLMATQKHTGRPVGQFKLNLRLQSQIPIKSIYSPTHELKIDRGGDGEATVKLDLRDVIPEDDFRLLYTLDKNALGVTVLSTRPEPGKDGYFLLLASPEIKKSDEKPQPKTVVFVLDHSGSMSGEKIVQARDALRFVLNNLKEGDTFNIVSYNDMIECFKPELQSFNDKSRAAAAHFIDTIEAGGSTNIDEALATTLKMIGDGSTRPAYILFMTDGLPTAGETNELKIAEHCRTSNKSGARLFAFGVGYDANARLLDRLSGGNGGSSEYVRPSENIESHVAAFYSKLTSPVLSGIKLTASHGDPGQIYPVSIPDLFEGGQLVLAGRYREPGAATLTLTGKVGGKEVSTTYPVNFADADAGSGNNFVERLWAMRRIGYLIDQIDLVGQNKELTDELTRLSTKYGILTPYTAFLADDRVQVWAYERNSVQTESLMRSNLSDASGVSGQAQRAFKQKMLAAPAPAAAAPKMSLSFGGGGGARASGGSASGGVRAGTPLSAGDAWQVKGDNAKLEEQAQRADRVRQMGPRTFYLKEGVWVDSRLNEAQIKSAVTLEQFSEPFFKLSRGLPAADNQYLAFSEPVVVEIGGKVYRVTPVKK